MEKHVKPSLASIDDRQSHKSLQPETDLLILDYLLHETTNRLLIEANDRLDGKIARKQDADRLMAAVPSFLQLCKQSDSWNRVSDDIKDDIGFRLELWKFTSLFTRRLEYDRTTPTPEQLQQLRDEHSSRAKSRHKAFQGTDISFPSALAFHDLHGDRIRSSSSWTRQSYLLPLFGSNLAQINDDKDLFFRSKDACALLDLLPDFMHLSATCSKGLELTTDWMNLAAEFMQQAVLENCLCREVPFEPPCFGAFAWGYVAEGATGCESAENPVKSSGRTEEDAMISAMFQDGDDAHDRELPEWTRIRNQYANGLTDSRHGKDTRALLNPIDKFERQLLSYLNSINLSTPKPVMCSIKAEQQDGRLSVSAIRNLLKSHQAC